MCALCMRSREPPKFEGPDGVIEILGRGIIGLKHMLNQGYQGWSFGLLAGWCRMILITILTRNSFNRSTPEECSGSIAEERLAADSPISLPDNLS